MHHWPMWLRLANKRLVQLQEMLIRNQRVIGRPFHLTLESGNACNLRCPLCPTTFREDSLPHGILSFENARTIIDRFPALLVLNLSLWGEPFLNKEIFKIIRHARANKIDVMIQSNFSLPHFDEAMAQAIIDSDLTTLWLSIDGASQNTYEMYRRRGDFALVMRNLELLRRLQKQQKKSNPQVTWKMVVNKFNDHEVQEAKSAADRLGVDFLTVDIYVPEHLRTEWQGKSKHSGIKTHTDKMTKCFHLWQGMSVNFNGDVFPCCSEWSPKDALGNLLRESVAELWNRPDYRQRRANNKSGPPACDSCHIDKDTNYQKQWYPTSEGEKNPLMLPLTLVKPSSSSEARGGPCQ
jgi:radical SAM protein with 4Fe4S-binding SPASM domain